jgi:murein DD-endopeptidase MepM/ murein hydrolase activator NlpD
MGPVLALLVSALVPSCYLPPVAAPVPAPFVAPACEYCPGHRGLEYTTAPGTIVRAAAAGVVTFAGVVVDSRYVVVRHADGISATYGDLAASTLRSGDDVAAGSVVGTATSDLYFGLRRNDVYLDPADYLGVPRHRPRLVPSSGARPRPAARGSVTCPALGRA